MILTTKKTNLQVDWTYLWTYVLLLKTAKKNINFMVVKIFDLELDNIYFV